MPPRTAAIALVCGALIPAHAALAVAQSSRHDIDVRVYDVANVDPHAKQLALDVAAATLASASIRVLWRDCGSASCTSPVDDELVLRLVRSPAQPDGDRGRAALPLGDAYIDRVTGAGVLATVYADRVGLLAASAGAGLATLLGRTIAHELGHLLLGSRAHGARGLMRPMWSARDLRHGTDADWSFGAQEIASLRARLSARRAAAVPRPNLGGRATLLSPAPSNDAATDGRAR